MGAGSGPTPITGNSPRHAASARSSGPDHRGKTGTGLAGGRRPPTTLTVNLAIDLAGEGMADTGGGSIDGDGPFGVDHGREYHAAVSGLDEDPADLVNASPGAVAVEEKHENFLDAVPESGHCEPEPPLDVLRQILGPTHAFVLQVPDHVNLPWPNPWWSRRGPTIIGIHRPGDAIGRDDLILNTHRKYLW